MRATARPPTPCDVVRFGPGFGVTASLSVLLLLVPAAMALSAAAAALPARHAASVSPAAALRAE